MEYIVRTYKLGGLFNRTFTDKGGTIVVPTTDAFDDLLVDLGTTHRLCTAYTTPCTDISLANLTTAVTNATWARYARKYNTSWCFHTPPPSVLPSYFLTNTSYLPKDFFNQVYQTSGNFFLYASLFRNASSSASILLRYVDITSSVIRSGAQPVANIAPFGKPAMVTDFSLVCDQFVVYWVDSVLLPVANLCALTREGCGGNTTLGSVVNALKASG